MSLKISQSQSIDRSCELRGGSKNLDRSHASRGNAALDALRRQPANSPLQQVARTTPPMVDEKIVGYAPRSTLREPGVRLKRGVGCETVRATRSRHPFHINAWVVLPEHMHCLWTLPPGDANFALRWKVIKFAFAKRLPIIETRTANQQRRGERGIWQRRYWEHLIRDELDYQRHFDYIHVNPIKHGHVERLVDWPYSSFHRAVAMGVYPKDWCAEVDDGDYGE